MITKKTKFIGFPIPRQEQKTYQIPNSHHKTRKIKTRTKKMQDKNLIEFYYKNKTRKNVPKTNVEQTKGNRKLYPDLYLLGTWVQS
jgi:hypothetical protein